MKTILRLNGTKKAFFQTIDSDIQIIKNEKIADYSTDFKKYHFDLARSGDLVRLEFSRDIQSFVLDCEFCEISVDSNLSESITPSDFESYKKAFAIADRISKFFNYCTLPNDESVIIKLLQKFKVQAVFIEIDGQRKTMSKKEALQNIPLIMSLMDFQLKE